MPPAALLPIKTESAKIKTALAGFRFTLTGITTYGTERLALINNQVVGVGEKLKENATVLEIQGQKVALDFQGKRIELEL